MSLLLLFQNNLPVPTPGQLQVCEQSAAVATLPVTSVLVSEQSAAIAFHQPGLIVSEQSAAVAILVSPPAPNRRRQYYLM